MFRKKWALLGVAILCLSCCLLYPAVVKDRRDEPYIVSQGRLRNIGQALANYHAAYGCLPAAAVRDKDGKPLYSWRVRLLPYLDLGGVYMNFKRDEPWESPQNKPLSEFIPHVYAMAYTPEEEISLARYQVFVGPGTAFERDGLTFEDFPDGLANTILVVEGGEPVPWSKPAELAYDPAKPLPALGGLYTKPVHFLGYEVRRKPGFNALFADGTVRFIPSDTDETIIRALITRNGGELVDLSKLDMALLAK